MGLWSVCSKQAMPSDDTPPPKSPCCSVQYSREVSGLQQNLRWCGKRKLLFFPRYQMPTVHLIFKATFQTLSSGLWSKHTWGKIYGGDLSQHFYLFFLCVSWFPPHIWHWGFPSAHVVFCHVFAEIPLPAWSFHLLVCLLKEEWSGTKEGS